MAKKDMGALLKNRMSATQQASELHESNNAYAAIFGDKTSMKHSRFCELPIDALHPFFTADIGFKPYPQKKLNAFAQEILEVGILVRIIVRPIKDTNRYEILSGHNRTAAAKLAGFKIVPVEIVEAEDDRAIVIATTTNLIQRQNLSIIERGKAYKALLDAKNRCGQKNIIDTTFGENRQRYNARQIVAEFFGVTEYEIRKAVKLTKLIPEIQEMLEAVKPIISIGSALSIAEYDPSCQMEFYRLCQKETAKSNTAAIKAVAKIISPQTATPDKISEMWTEHKAADNAGKTSPRKISLDIEKYAQYINPSITAKELEQLFIEFLKFRKVNSGG